MTKILGPRSFCRQYCGCDLEQAKATVRAAIAKATTQ